MRTFFLGDSLLTRCGVKGGGGSGGLAYFCPSCARTWARVEIGWLDWMAARIPCADCGPISGYSGAPGSFLKPLVWWDHANGRSLADQLVHADKTLLNHETEVHMKWLQKDAK